MSLIAFVKAREGCRFEAYWDAAGKVWTIGYGCTGPHITKGTVWTQTQCDAALADKLAQARVELLKLSPRVNWPPGALDSLTDFVYNEGSGHYAGSTVRKCAEAGDWPGVRLHLLDWEKAGGKRLAGLVTRREGEAAMIATPPPAVVQSSPDITRSLPTMKTTFLHIVAYITGALATLASLNPAIVSAIVGPKLGAYAVPVITLSGALVAFIHSVLPSTATPAAPPASKQSGYVHVKILGALVVLSALGLAACASIESFLGSPTGAVVLTAAVDVAVATAESKGVSAAQINKIAHAGLTADTGVSGTLGAVSGLVNTAIAKANLPPLDAAAAEVLEVALSAAIQAKIGSSTSVASAQAAVADVLNAVAAATGG